MEENTATNSLPCNTHSDGNHERNVSHSTCTAKEEETNKSSCTSSSTMMNKTSKQEDTIPKDRSCDGICDHPQDDCGNCSSPPPSSSPSARHRQHQSSSDMLNQQNHATEPSFNDTSPAFHQHSSYSTTTSPTVGPAGYYYDGNMHYANTYDYMQASHPPFVPSSYPGTFDPYHFSPGYNIPPSTHSCIIHQYIPVAVPVSIVHHYVREVPNAKAGTSPNRSHRIVSNHQSKPILYNNGPSQRPSKSISVDEEHSEVENSSRAQSSLSSISRYLEQTDATEVDKMPEDYPSRIVSPSRSPKRRRKRGKRKKNCLNSTISELSSFNESFNEDDLHGGLISDVAKIEIYESENEETQSSTPAASTNDDNER
jgi:hypothetical protein